MKAKQEVLSFVRQMDQYPGFTRGWGNGYIIVPPSHPLVKEFRANRTKSSFSASSLGYHSYVDMPNQECTWVQYAKDTSFIPRDIRKKVTPRWLVIGFDTAHIYNNSSHDWVYVLEETKKWKEYAESWNCNFNKIIKQLESK